MGRATPVGIAMVASLCGLACPLRQNCEFDGNAYARVECEADDILVSYERGDTTCSTLSTSSRDCKKDGAVCMAAQCVPTCASDADCATGTICNHDARSTCTPPLAWGTLCATQPSHCGAGLTCGSSDADGGADPTCTADEDAGPHAKLSSGNCFAPPCGDGG